MYWHRNTLKNRKWNTTVDCRNYTEFEKGHYNGAIHWPIETLTYTNFKQRLHELSVPVLVYDNTGKLSSEWYKKFTELSKEYGLKGYTVAHTDAHWT
jgi:rhodanese-related sulfurtransferase